MKRRLLTLLTVVSLLLCVAAVALWARSYAAFDWLKLSEAELVPPELGAGRRVAATEVLFSWRGRLGYVRSTDFAGPVRAGSYPLVWRPTSERDHARNAETLFIANDLERRWNRWTTPAFDWAGFHYVVHQYGWDGGMHVVVPYWALVALATLAPAVRTTAFVRRTDRGGNAQHIVPAGVAAPRFAPRWWRKR